jgi:hypothetical protein
MADENNTTAKINLKVTGTQELEATKATVSGTTAAVGDLSKATGELAAATETAVATGKELTLTHRDTKELVEVITKIFPKLGEGIGNLFKGPIGQIALAAQFYEWQKGEIDKANAESDKRGALNAQPEGAGLSGAQQAWDNAAESAAKYFAAVSAAQKDNDPVGTEIKRARDVTEARIEEEKRQVAAQGKSEEDKLRQNNATQEQVAAAHAQTRTKLDALDDTERVGTGSGLLQQEQLERAAQSVKLRNAAAVASDDFRKAEVKHTEFKTALDKARSALDPKSDEGKALQKRIDDAAAKVEEAETEPDVMYGYATSPPIDNTAAKKSDIAAAEAELEKANAELTARKLQVGTAEATQVQNDFEYELAKKLQENALQASKHNEDRLARLPGEIIHAQEVENIHREGTAQTEAINAASGPADGTASAAHPSGRPLNCPTGLNEKDPCIDRLNTLLSSINANQEAMLGLMNRFVDDEGRIAQQIEALTSKHTTIQRQLYHLQRTGNK